MDASKDRIGYLFFAALGAAAFWMASDFKQESAIFPRVISGAMVVLGSGLVLLSYLRRSQATDRLASSQAGSHDEPVGWFIHSSRFATVVGLTMVYFMAVPRLGYYTASALTILVGAMLLGLHARPVLVISTTIIYLLLVYLSFGVFFQKPLPPEAILRLLP